MKCVNCLKEISDNSKFCEYCGTKVENNENPRDLMQEYEEFLENQQIEEDLKKDKNINKRISIWKEKLIDLSKRNRLLNFKLTKFSTLRIIDEQPPEVFRTLVLKSAQMEFLPVKTAQETLFDNNLSLEELNYGIEFKSKEFEEYNVENLENKHVDKFLQTKLSQDDLNKTLGKISTTAKSTNDDLGYNVLFLALGSVIWYESDNSEEKFEAPLVLVPVEIKRKNVTEPYKIKYNEGSVILNPALVLKFKRDFGINLEEISFDEDNINPVEIFSCVQKKINTQSRWKLLNNIYIGLFSFAKFVMYKDIDINQEIIKNNDLIKTICGLNEEKQIQANEICPIDKLDEIAKPKETYQILDADSSQRQAIQVVKQGNNLVIQGPPGTGKSQTIANIISELLSQDKKVLFVSQKIAALDVVKNRLEKNGLAPFCLELHSNKTNRKKIIEELINTFEYNSKNIFDESFLSKLELNIKSLKKYVEELHTPTGNLNYKPYQAMGFVLNNSDISDFGYIFDDYEKYDYEKFSNAKNLFNQIQNILKKLGNPQDFPLFGSQIRDIEYEKKQELKNLIKTFLSNFENLTKNTDELTQYFMTKNIANFSQINNLLKLQEIISNVPNSAVDNILSDEIKMMDDIKIICNNVKQFNIYNNRIKNKFNLGILNEDVENLIQKFSIYKNKLFSRISFKFYKDCKFLRSFFIKNYKPNLDELLYDLNNVKELKNWIEKLEECDFIASDLYDKNWNKNNPNEEDIKKCSQNLLKFREIAKSDKFFLGDILEKFNREGINYQKIEELSKNIVSLKDLSNQSYDEICKILQLDSKCAFGEEFHNIQFDKLKEKFSLILEALDDLTLWFKYLNTLDEIKKASLEEFLNKCIELNIPLDDYKRAFEVQFLRVWLNGYVFRNIPVLKDFNSLEQDYLVSEFKNFDKKQIDITKNRLILKLLDNIEKKKEEFNKETLELKRLSKLQRFRKSLRQIIKSIPNIFLALKPCLMMSPTTVAQLLDLGVFKFDVVIFDEASQLTTEDCIGSIIRGEKLVVAGDDRQLPPTSFFKTVVDTENDEEEDNSDDFDVKTDLASILDECTTSGFPQCMLKWHYRSKHEYLIAFSNKHLYQELYTFPSCIEDSETLGIKFYYNEPKAITKENKRLEEAQIIARAVMNHAKKYPNLSLGVATLNIKQKALIEAELERLRQQDSSCEEFFDDNKSEYFFIKNLESIQGDERDVIMISVGYFKNQNGILPMNFGPINKEGGERRLNVLITRARYMVQIFSGIKASDFNLDKTNSKGVQLFRQYLDFAQRGEIALRSAIAENNEDNFDSPFEKSVCTMLRQKGYSVKTQIGCSGYKIDLAIRDKNNPGHFLVGIECDGASYHSCATARDRDRLRQEILEQLGWKIYRIWSTDWFKNPYRELDKLITFIKNLEFDKKTAETVLDIQK